MPTVDPQACHLCNAASDDPHSNADHPFWSNRDALRELRSQTPAMIRYSDGTSTPEASYVATYRPY